MCFFEQIESCPDDCVSYESAARQFEDVKLYKGYDIRNLNELLVGNLNYDDPRMFHMFSCFAIKSNIPRSMFIPLQDIPQKYITYF